MYYQKTGKDSGIPLVLLHSGGMAGVEWQPQLQWWSKHWLLLIPDLPGHGQSVLKPGAHLSISIMAKAVLKMLEKEKVDKIHLLGSSMGGAVALWLTLNYPELVNKLVIYRIGYRKNQQTHQQTQSMATPDYWRHYGLHHWLSKLHAPQGGEEAWKSVIANVSKVLDPQTSEHNHSLSDLSNLSSPTLLIAGDRDPLVPLTTLFEMQQSIPDCALWVMPKATHITASNTWRAKMFADEVSRFLL